MRELALLSASHFYQGEDFSTEPTTPSETLYLLYFPRCQA